MVYMKIRVISDLHVDLNEYKTFDFENKLGDTDLILIAGDISGE